MSIAWEDVHVDPVDTYKMHIGDAILDAQVHVCDCSASMGSGVND